MKTEHYSPEGEQEAGIKVGNLDAWISTDQATKLLDTTKSAVKRACKAGKYHAKQDESDGRRPYLILVSSLPELAQAAWFREQNPQLFGLKHQVNQATKEALWERYEQAPDGLQQRATGRHEIVLAYFDLERAGVPHKNIIEQIGKRFGKGASKETVWRLRQTVLGQSPDLWLPLLLPRWKGNVSQAELSEEAWQWILHQWGTTSKPALKAVWRRAKIEEGPKRGWIVPSYDAVKSRIDALPGWQHVMLRDGIKALQQMYPAQKRDYSLLQVHDIWVVDGRKADVFAEWEDGSVSRPILVPWMDVRSRKLLGYVIGKTESADLIRLAFKRATESTRAIPKEALMDNGRGFAGRLMTGGQKTRFRFKVKDEGIPGILTMLGVRVIWAMPGHGQSKPVEPWFKNIAEREKSREFVGAYCGNRPEAKPEDFKGKAVPIAAYRNAVETEINAFNERAHRGHAMNSRSPNQIYAALIDSAIVTQPTPQQLRLCLLAAENVRLTGKEQSVKIHENRYWSEELANLDPRTDYVARFNPEDASEPISLYLGEKFLCTASPVSLTGFRDQQAAKDHARAHNQFKKARKAAAKATLDMNLAKAWDAENEDLAEPPASPAPPRPKVVRLMRSPIQLPKEEEETSEIDPEEFKRIVLSQQRASADK
jgi:hypothetical protein